MGTGAIGKTENLDGGTDNHFGRGLLHCAHGEPCRHAPVPPTECLQHASPAAATQWNRRGAIDAGHPICREGGRVSDERRQGHQHAEEHRMKGRMLHISANQQGALARTAGLIQPLPTTHFVQNPIDIASTGRCSACPRSIDVSGQRGHRRERSALPFGINRGPREVAKSSRSLQKAFQMATPPQRRPLKQPVPSMTRLSGQQV